MSTLSLSPPAEDLPIPAWLFELEEKDEEEKTSAAAEEVNAKLESERGYDDREKKSGVFNVCQV